MNDEKLENQKETLLKEPEKLSQYLEQGIDRIVLTLL